MRELLVELRKKRNLTQLELANKLKLSEVYVRKLENGTRNPSVQTMLKYERFFKVPMQEIFPDIFFSMNDTKCIKTIV